MQSRRIDGATPNGGAYTVLFFQDEVGKPVDESQATRCEMVEYDQEGEGFFRSYIRLQEPTKAIDV